MLFRSEAEAAFKKEADAWEKAHPNFKDEIKKAHEARDKDAIHKLMEQRKPVMESRKSAVEKLRASLTDEQKAQIAAMVETGNVAGAQGVILGEVERQFRGSAAAAAWMSHRVSR